MRPRSRSGERGFTLIEVMIVCVILAILAALVIPQFMEESRKVKASSEVSAFFAELAARQESFRMDNSVYFPNPTGTTATCPAATSTTGTVVDCTAVGKPWNGLNVNPPMQTAYCKYTMTSGSGTGTGNQTINGNVFTFTSPTGIWYFMRAECDLNGNGTFATYFTSSVDSTIQKANESE